MDVDMEDPFEGDHHRLMQIMDSLVESVAVAAGDETVRDVLLRLLAALTDHFGGEQQLMRSMAYPDHDEHANEHRWFLDHVSGLLESHARGPRRLTLEQAQSLRPWLEDHNQTHDRALTEYALTR